MSKIINSLRYIGIIPARYASTRLPGKPLLTIGEKSILQHVYERAIQVLERVVVATDDDRIVREVESWNGAVVMTSLDHQSGTDRIREALELQEGEYDVVINIQGDEPFVSPHQLSDLMSAFEDPEVDIATLIHAYPAGTSLEALSNSNQVKVVKTLNGRALYFSRSVIPYYRGYEGDMGLAPVRYYRHLGLYAYRSSVLRAITEIPMSALEQTEKLEQLRWLEHGYTIQTVLTDEQSIGIDTPEDLEQARAYYEKLHK